MRTALVNILEYALETCLEDPLQKSHHIDFRIVSNDQDVVFEIIDDGPGMSGHEASQIFNMFSSTKGRKGTGLGLFITKSVMKKHGGSIEAHSQPGGGTSFLIRLPRN